MMTIRSEKGMSLVVTVMAIATFSILATGLIQYLESSRKTGNKTVIQGHFARLASNIKIVINDQDTCTSSLGNQDYTGEIKVMYPFLAQPKTVAEAGQQFTGYKIDSVQVVDVRTLNPSTHQKLGYIQIQGTPHDDVSFLGNKLKNRILINFTTDNSDTIITKCSAQTSVVPSATNESVDFCINNINNPSAVFGTAGNDFLQGTAGNDVIYGLEGHDVIIGGGGNDILCGGPGMDFIVAKLLDGDNTNTTDRNQIDGGDDDDFIQGGNGDDTIYGGDGNDILYGLGGTDQIDGGNGNDVFDGGDGNDLLIGNAGNDIMLGGDGHDNLDGGPGDDTLLGQQGNDTLNGGANYDQLDGGTNNDICQSGADRHTVLLNCETIN